MVHTRGGRALKHRMNNFRTLKRVKRGLTATVGGGGGGFSCLPPGTATRICTAHAHTAQEAAETGTHPADIVKGDQRFHAFRVVKQKKDCQSTRYWNPNHCKFMLKRINTQDNPRIPRHLKHPPYKCAQSVPPDICKRLEHILK